MSGLSLAAIKLESSDGKIHKFADFKNYKYVVLYFYPRDNTSGCTTEALEFTSLLPEFEKVSAKIIGVSPDSRKSHERFIDKHNLEILLASDENHEIAKQFGAWGEKISFGRKRMGIIRSTFIIDLNLLEVIKEFRNVRAKGHAGKVLEYLISIG